MLRAIRCSHWRWLLIISPDSATYHTSPRKQVHDIKTGHIKKGFPRAKKGCSNGLNMSQINNWKPEDWKDVERKKLPALCNSLMYDEFLPLNLHLLYWSYHPKMKNIESDVLISAFGGAFRACPVSFSTPPYWIGLRLFWPWLICFFIVYVQVYVL